MARLRYASPTKHWPLTAAAVTVGIVWGLWHVPRDVATGVIERLGETQYVVQYLPAFLLGTIAVSIIATVAMNRLGGSIVPAVVVHGLTNDSIGIAGSVTVVQALTPYHQITKAAPLLTLSLLLLAVFRSGTSNDTSGVVPSGTVAPVDRNDRH